MSGTWRIMCDAGGTNIRLARSLGVRDVRDTAVLPTSTGLALEAALISYSARFGGREACGGVVIAAAGAVENGAVHLTNADVSICESRLRAELGKPVRVLNDLEAVAWGLPHLTSAERASLCDVALPLAGPRLAVNVGTGFGAALLIDTPQGAFVTACEPGHMKLASGRVLSPGMLTAAVSIEEAISGLALGDAGRAPWSLPAHLQTAQGTCGLFEAASACAEGRRFIADFSVLLGQVCGDLVLATGAWGGVYLCGSVATAWFAHADRERFCAAYCDKGPMQARMRRTGIYVISVRTPAFYGLSAVPLA